MWGVVILQATDEIMRLLGLTDKYSSLSEAERMKLLAHTIATPPPVDKLEVCLLCLNNLHQPCST